MADFVRQYGVATDFYIPVVKASSSDFAASADWTPVSGDVQVIIDGVANGVITTLPTAVSARYVWKFPASAAEMTGANIAFIVVDSATKAITDQAIVVSTFGHQSAADPRGIIRRATAVLRRPPRSISMPLPARLTTSTTAISSTSNPRPRVPVRFAR